MRAGVRGRWSGIPAHVRAEIDELLGARVVQATNLAGGFSPGPAARCDLADGRRVFVKAAGTELNPISPGMHRSEAAVLTALPPDHPAPTLIGVVDDGDWVALLVEWVDGATPDLPLSAAGWRRMLTVADRLAVAGDGCRPDGIGPFEERHRALTGHWQRLAADGGEHVDRLDPWSRDHLDRLADLDVASADAASGDTLLQLDLRTDNVLFSPLGPGHDVVVDWPSAAIGAAWVDLVTMLPALHVDGAPRTARALRRASACSGCRRGCRHDVPRRLRRLLHPPGAAATSAGTADLARLPGRAGSDHPRLGRTTSRPGRSMTRNRAASESCQPRATLGAVRTLVCAAVAIVALAACGDDPVESDGPRFCGEAIENRSSLVAPPLNTEAEVEATLEFYRLMGQLAPVAIAEEWNVVLTSLETAATLVPGDPESEQLVARTAYASEPSAFAVKKWLLENCGLDIPITTIAPQEAVPAQTTTIAPVDTTEGTNQSDE